MARLSKNAVRGVGASSSGSLAVITGVSCFFLAITGIMLKECRATNWSLVKSLAEASDKKYPQLPEQNHTAVLHNLSMRIRTAQAALEKLQSIETHRYQELVRLNNDVELNER
eukprot:TRINITY_DN76661_c0_g1_i1.p2 TRINITY_DN76661_c0_g1~~TRINITY_DN76661_c0_g1_i1.p2  ORF type:complete len:113 (-),score=18.38 TRINITY_DN76661_c0_g1_i1:335-673(-)